MATTIGTLNEGALHAGLKRWLARPGDVFEQPVDGYVIDVVRGDLLIEIQTGGFAPLRRKLADLLERHRVRLVVPIARLRTIQRVDAKGAHLSRRRSPIVGRIEDVFERLVSIPSVVAHERFELELLEIAEIEVRAPRRTRRRKGWIVCDRELVDVLERNLIRDASDLAALLPDALPEAFSTADVARLAALPRATAQQMLYCLLGAGALERAGKNGNAHLYRRAGDSRSGRRREQQSMNTRACVQRRAMTCNDVQ